MYCGVQYDGNTSLIAISVTVLLILQKEIGQAAYNASSKLLGPYDTTLCILLGVLVGLISILKICETIYHCAVQKKGLQDTDNSGEK